MKNNKIIFIFVIILVVKALAYAQEDKTSWKLPLKLTDKNTMVNFEVDSTWHMVNGITSNVEGEVELNDSQDKLEINIKIPVKNFNTDNSMRDSKMRKVMASDNYPYVLFAGSKSLQKCSPDLILKNGTCSDTISGLLKIHGTGKKVTFPVNFNKTETKKINVEGELTIKWSEYGVEDPSIFIAKLNPNVKIIFEVNLDIKN